MPFFIDSHCHFDFSDFDNERDSIWQACQTKGVVALVIPGVALEQWSQAKTLSNAFSNIYFSAGVHPWWVGQMFSEGNITDDALEALRKKHITILKTKHCVAVGECGLDKMIQAPVGHQFAVFDYQVKLAAELEKPLILHSRKAHNEIMKHLDSAAVSKGGVIHGFSGNQALAHQYIDRGFYIGVGGTVTYDRAKKTHDAIRGISLDHIVLETDAPSMPIQGKQGKRNSPEYLPEIAYALAELKNVSVDEVAQRTTHNTCQLFGLNVSDFMH